MKINIKARSAAMDEYFLPEERDLIRRGLELLAQYHEEKAVHATNKTGINTKYIANHKRIQNQANDLLKSFGVK